MPVASLEMRDGKLHASVKRTERAPTETVWEVMTDHPACGDVAGNISKVEVLSGDGLGMKRRCYGPKGENWQETCHLYETGHAYGFRMHTEADDYPYADGKPERPRGAGSADPRRRAWRAEGGA